MSVEDRFHKFGDKYTGDNEIIFGEDEMSLSDYGYCEAFIVENFRHRIKQPSVELISLAEAVLDTTFGDQLLWLLTTYGYVSYAGVETLSLSNRMWLNSPLIRDTMRFRQLYELPPDMIVFFKSDDNYIYCCNDLDMVYRYSLWERTLTPIHIPLEAFWVREGIASMNRYLSHER